MKYTDAGCVMWSYQMTRHISRHARLAVCLCQRQREKETARDIKTETETETQWQMVAAHKAADAGDLIRNRRREKRFSSLSSGSGIRRCLHPTSQRVSGFASRPSQTPAAGPPGLLLENYVLGRRGRDATGRLCGRWQDAIREEESKRPVWRANERPRPSVTTGQCSSWERENWAWSSRLSFLACVAVCPARLL